MSTTVLYVCHNHPSVRPGGGEQYALELHRAMAERDDVESVFLAKGGPPLSNVGQLHLGTYVSPVGRRDDEYFLFTDGYDYDWFYGTMKVSKELYTKHYRDFLLSVRPDVVHFHHTMFLGYDLLRATRAALPDAAIIYTLHEFMPICHRQGQMVRTVDGSRCMEESPRRCHECFPEISPQQFFLRKRFVQSHFAVVDQFIAPSEFLMDRYLDWGIPPERIRVEEYGRSIDPFEEGDPPARRDRIGFFGQLNPFKGIRTVLLAWQRLMAEAGDGAAAVPHLRVHGANLDLQPGNFQNEIAELLEATAAHVTFVGRYEKEQIAEMMREIDWVVIPSTWWENSPLVIQEAFAHGRPVIASDIGGMAEKVTDDVDGLHFRAGDPDSLARTVRTAVSTPGLWERLHGGIRPVYDMDHHVSEISSLYESVREARRTDGRVSSLSS